jgi:putative endonuclease
MYYTYVLYSKQYQKIYVGYTSNLENRLSAHNDIRNTGWTSKYQPWVVLHREVFESKQEAMKREKQLKSSRGRAFIHEELLGSGI